MQSLLRDGLSQTQAYRKNYNAENMDDKDAATAASAVMKVPKVAARVAELRERREKTAAIEFDITVKKLMQTFFEIAYTDPNELISVRAGACRHCWGVGGAYQWKEREYLEAVTAWEKKPSSDMPDPSGGFGYRFAADPNPECEECEGEGISRLVPKDTTKLSAGAKHLYRGAQQTKDGMKILFADKDGALDKLSRILGAYDDRLRVDLKGAVASMQLTTSDPIEAAREYEKMLAGGGK